MAITISPAGPITLIQGQCAVFTISATTYTAVVKDNGVSDGTASVLAEFSTDYHSLTALTTNEGSGVLTITANDESVEVPFTVVAQFDNTITFEPTTENTSIKNNQVATFDVVLPDGVDSYVATVTPSEAGTYDDTSHTFTPSSTYTGSATIEFLASKDFEFKLPNNGGAETLVLKNDQITDIEHFTNNMIVKVETDETDNSPKIKYDVNHGKYICKNVASGNPIPYTIKALVDGTEVTFDSQVTFNLTRMSGSVPTTSVVYTKTVDKTHTVTIDVTESRETTQLTVDPTTITCQVEGNESELTVTTDATDYTLDSVEDTILEIREDKANNKVYVSAKATADGLKPKDTTVFNVKARADGKLENTQEVTVNLEDKQFVTELSISPESIVLQQGAEATIVVNTNADDFTFTNSDSSKVSFDKDSRKVTALLPGSANITFSAKYKNGAEVTKTLVVTVEAVEVIETSLVVTPNQDLNLVKGDKQVFQVTTNATDYSVELSNSTLGTFDKTTKTLTTTETGTLKLIFKAQRKDSVEKTVEVICVINDVRLTADVTSIKVNKGDSATFSITSNVIGEVKVEAAEFGYVTLSRNSNIVTVAALKVGETEINISVRGVELTIPVTVTDTTLLTVEPQTPNMYLDGIYNSIVTTNAATYSVEVDDEEVLGYEVTDNNIKFTPKKGGVATIRVKATAEGGLEKSVSWSVTVIEQSNYSEEEADSILTNANTTVAEKLDAFKNDTGKFGVFVNNLVSYNKSMSPNAEETLSDEKGAAKNYNLYIQIKDCVSKTDYKEFKTEFDIINMVYLNYAKDAFDEFALFRYDQAWASKWGNTSLTTFQNLNTVICSLCDIKTRAANLASISLDKSLDTTVLELDEIAVNNIKKYYEV